MLVDQKDAPRCLRCKREIAKVATIDLRLTAEVCTAFRDRGVHQPEPFRRWRIVVFGAVDRNLSY